MVPDYILTETLTFFEGCCAKNVKTPYGQIAAHPSCHPHLRHQRTNTSAPALPPSDQLSLNILLQHIPHIHVVIAVVEFIGIGRKAVCIKSLLQVEQALES